MDHAKAFLGRGFSFPPEIDPATGKFKMVSAEDDIEQAVYIILMTRIRERAMLPEFGCNMQEYIFELPDRDMIFRIEREVQEALTKYEPRIINVEVGADLKNIQNGVIYLNISYVVRSTNNPNNLVFPYYLEEGIGE